MTKVLIIDDERIIRERLKNLLESDGYRTFVAKDGQSGLEYFNKELPEIVLVDIKMPGIDGIEVLKKIKTVSKETEVIIITGHGSISNTIHALNEGAFAYIQKPIEYDELVINIKKALEKQEVQRQLVRNEEKYQDIFENANDLIQILDKKARFIDVNKKWSQVLGFTKKEAKKKTLWDILRSDQVLHCQKIFKKILAGQSLSAFETVFVAKNGDETDVEGSASARFKNNRFVSTRGIFRDITKRKATEKKLQKKVLELEKFNKVVVGRELKMIELKEKIAELENRLKTKL